ncbi:MAG TPA: TIGR00266 family protein [Dehalococcoidia bacterium]|nr:TIGR00266 family protein [Dehalococcoidia bacterium]
MLYRPSYSLAVVSLSAGESVVAEAGAMVSMSGTVQMKTSARGGILKGLTRSLLGGESFFMNTFQAANGPGEVTLSPALPGDLIQLEVAGDLLVQSGSYLGSSPEVSVDTKWGGARSFFAGEGLFMLRVSGVGPLLVSSYGAIHEKLLGPGERYVVDTGHIVAFDGSMSYQVQRVGGLKSTLLGGEGLVAAFTGPGRILLQTRSPGAFLEWLLPQIPQRSSS